MIDDVGWMDQAGCRTSDPDRFFPGSRREPPPEDVQRLCDACPVRTECLAYALDHWLVGVWGGTVDKQREQLERPMRRARCPICAARILAGEPAGLAVQWCAACGHSWSTVPTGRPARRVGWHPQPLTAA